ncbi:hypothetical protein MKK70_25320 [Methylobacterium sp. E-041]|uniref:hypothetical protein n=1 Tax=Methylobacterium sp. E-041 TaxID=2836573 RepID=UPI001FB98AF9|nr:hypothetical protein [Methylobacterium sp. E-041]MCJ2108633.1 hypothetical protein [Methylobacterium sp. E-041]
MAAQAYRATVNAARIETIRSQSGARAKLWTMAGGFDRRAIMAFAVGNARCERGTWRERMAEALKHAWACAHAARRAGAH